MKCSTENWLRGFVYGFISAVAVIYFLIAWFGSRLAE